MDPCPTKVKPTLPPKPEFLKNKCKSLSCYQNNNKNNNNKSNKCFSTIEDDGISLLSSEVTPSNEDVFNNNNNLEIYDRRCIHESDKLNKVNFNRGKFLNSNSSVTLPVGIRPKCEVPSNLLYRSGGTVRVSRMFDRSMLGFNIPQEMKLDNSRAATKSDGRVFLEPSKIDPTNFDNSLEHFVPLNPSPHVEWSSVRRSSNKESTFHDKEANTTLKIIDSNNNTNNNNNINSNNTNNNNTNINSTNNNNTNNNSITSSNIQSNSVLSENKSNFEFARGIFGNKNPPLARISTKRIKRRPIILPKKSTITQARTSSEIKSIDSNSMSNKSADLISKPTSSFSSVQLETENLDQHDNLDILIPIVFDSSSRGTKNSGKKPQTRARSEWNISRNETTLARQVASKSSLSELSTQSTFEPDKLESSVDVKVPTNPEILDQRKDGRFVRKKPSVLYLSMNRINKDPMRKYISSCTDLVHQAKFGRVERLIHESFGEKKKSAGTLPCPPKTIHNMGGSVSPTSSPSADDKRSPKPLIEFDDNKRISSSSSDNYGALSDDDDDDYVSREEFDDQTLESSSVRDVSRGSTLNASSGDVLVSIDDARMFDDTSSYGSSSFEYTSSRSSMMNDSHNSSNSNNNNEIKRLVLGDVRSSIERTFIPRDFSSPFFSSSQSSAASSTISLDNRFTFQRCSSTDAVRTRGDLVAGASVQQQDENKERLNRSDPVITNPIGEVKKSRKDPFLVAKEIMTSEEKFIEVLKLLNEDFPNFIQSERSQGRVNDGPVDARQLIHDLPNLQQVNKELFKQLKQRIENWDKDPRIADIFIKTGHFLKLYTNYIKNFSHVVQEFDAIRRKNPEFDKALTEFECSPVCNRLAIKHYMLKPIQRIPQYKLLLQEYLKCLSPTSPDYGNTQEAIPIVTGVSEHANESVRNWENQYKIINIQSMLLGGYQIIKPGRRFIKEGRLMKLSRKEMQARMFFLFNDLLLYTTPAGGNNFKVNQAISLDGLTVSLSATEDTENEFSIISVERSFTVAASSKEERQQWVSALESAVLEHMEIKNNLEEAIKLRCSSSLDPIRPSKEPSGSKPGRSRVKNGVASLYESAFKIGDRAPVWIQDERASMCMACTRGFSVTFRRHHCRGCGKIVCSDCSSWRAPLKYNGFKPARVCKDCYEYLERSIISETKEDYMLVSANDDILDVSSEALINPSSTSQPSTPFGKRSLSLLFKAKHSKRLSRSVSKPSILTEVQAFDNTSEMSGYLLQLEKKKWKRYWFVVKNGILYTFIAMQDKAAIRTMPLLSYQVQDGSSSQDNDEKTFEIFHDGLPPITLRAETRVLKQKWIDALHKAMTV